MDSDNQIIEAYLAGDEKSLEILINRYLKQIYGFVYQYVNNRQEAEDITQEVFVKVWRNVKKPVFGFSRGFNPKKGKFKTWLFTIAKNTSLDFLKKKKPLLFSEFENEKGVNVLVETLSDESPLPEEITGEKEARQALDSVIKNLPPKYRLILSLRRNNDFSFREISEILKEPLNTVKTRYRRALAMLKKIVAESK